MYNQKFQKFNSNRQNRFKRSNFNARKRTIKFVSKDLLINAINSSRLNVQNSVASNEKYINKGYDKRVYFIDFREAVVIGYKRVNDGNYVVLQDVVDHMKSLTTSILRNKFYGNEFDIYHDEELIPDFLSETQKKMGDRTEIRTPTDVHSTDAFRCFAGAWWKKNVVIEKPELEEDIAEDFGMVYPSMEHNENKLFQSKPIKPGFN